ncbi:MAG: master DNA invertase Mpi family serine-type recombinase [Candidatus Saccharibacteria bacterium]|nr:master DNA invertase Mpi family serine-type recombinase [Candidatus Saccharibacteria bacterium]
MIYGYIRVSTDKQTLENQIFEINNFCKKQGLKIDGWISETISGAKNYDKRRLGKLLRKIKKDDLIICVELSRLGRNLFMIMEILNICMTKECQVWTIKDGYRLGDDIQAKVLAFAFGLSAEIERTLLSQRTKEAMNRLKAEGRKLGRPVGTFYQKSYKLYGKEERIIAYMGLGLSWTKIGKRLRCHHQTVQRYVEKYMPEYTNFDYLNPATFPKAREEV